MLAMAFMMPKCCSVSSFRLGLKDAGPTSMPWKPKFFTYYMYLPYGSNPVSSMNLDKDGLCSSSCSDSNILNNGCAY